MRTELAARVWPKVDRSGGPVACWPWTGGISGTGYGGVHVFVDGRKARRCAHRVVYQLVVGEIPEGLDLDHLCRNRSCVNPAHLEPVTRSENLRRAQPYIRRRDFDRVCPRGHSLDSANLRVSRRADGRAKRYCRECDRARGH